MEDLIYMAWRKHAGPSAEDAPASAVVPAASSKHDPEADNLVTAPSVGVGKEKEKGGGHSMVLHHIITAVLCLGSWALNYTRIGSVVMFLHDISDIPLDLVRLCGR